MEPCITTIFGPPYTGKSSLALTWPGKIAYYNLERGGRRAHKWQELTSNGQVLERKLVIPHRNLAKRYSNLRGFEDAWTQLTDMIEKDMDNPEVQTIVFDTGSEVRLLAVDCYLEQMQKENPSKKALIQVEYATPNRWVENIFRTALMVDKHLVALYHERDDFAPRYAPDGEPVRDDSGQILREATGRKVPDGYNKAEAESDWILHSSMPIMDRAGRTVKPVPTVTVLKSPLGFPVLGLALDWPGYTTLEARLIAEGKKRETK